MIRCEGGRKEIFPFLRGGVSAARRVIGTYSNLREILKLANSDGAEEFAFLGTSRPDHFVRITVRPLHVIWDPGKECNGEELRQSSPVVMLDELSLLSPSTPLIAL